MSEMNTYNYMNRMGMNKSKVMKWLLCTAFFTLHSSLFTLTSCSDDPIASVAETDAPISRRAYSDDQTRMQRLGFAYNAAGNVMDDSSFTARPIINMNRLMTAEKKYGLIISSERRHYTSLDIFSGNTLEEVGHSETKYTVDDIGVAGCGVYFRKNSVFSHARFTSSYKAHMFVKHIMATMTIDLGMLYCMALDSLDKADNVLEADFRQAVANLIKIGEASIDTTKATEFSEKYGTHLVVSSNLGGMLELQMQINRDSCVDKEYTTQQVIEELVGEQVVTTSKPMLIKESLLKNTVEYEGEINVKGGRSEDCDVLHRTFDHKDAAAKKISDGDYYSWANNISIEPDSYNASFVSGRFVPYYQLFEDANTRKVLRKVYELYLKKEAPTKEIYEPVYGVMPVQGNYGPDVQVAAADTNKACIICQEYVPSIRSDKPCVVVYQLIRGNDNKSRPFLYTGLFVGDESHRPGRIIWQGSASTYIPSDSIFAESESATISELFDPATHALKNVYFYWNAIHAQPCPTKKDETPKKYTSTAFRIKPKPLAEATTFAKVASTFWSIRPVVPKTDSLKAYWKGDSRFPEFREHRYNQYDGVLYKTGNYCYCLLDGGDNIIRAPQYADDPDVHKRWIHAVSTSMKAIGLNDYLPNVEQSKSITRMLGNRMSIFYKRNNDGRNMLGLDWPTGHWVISDPSELETATVPTQSDGQGIPIVTNDANQARILRLSGSGTDLLLEYPEYIKAFNFSDQKFFKYFPIFITINNF
jgi:hypothetical protein